jgi:hypothetical protein
MDTRYDASDREWVVGERVIVASSHATSPSPRVLKIQRVAPKSFVVDGDRFRRDKLEDGLPTNWLGTGWGRFHVKVYPLDHPDAAYLIAKRALFKQERLVEMAEKAFHKDRSAVAADVLRNELGGWIEARNTFQREQEAKDRRGR